MKIEELRKYQLSQLELLDITDEICKKLNLKYYLIGGTLLGAVRHDGFIPWDADMDIAMPRKDYDAFLKYWMENPSDRYFYQHYKTEKNHLIPHAVLKIKDTRVYMNDRVTKFTPVHNGIYMDVFPLDNPPESVEKQEKQARKIKKIYRLIEIKASYEYAETSLLKKIAKKLVGIIMSPLTFRYLNKKLERCMSKYSSDEGKNLVSMASHYSYRKQNMPKDIYGTPQKIMFEGKEYFSPAKVHEYLERIYGDYMKLPPEEDRRATMDCILKVDYATEKCGKRGE